MENLTICKILTTLAFLLAFLIILYWNSLSALSTGLIALYILEENQTTSTISTTVTTTTTIRPSLVHEKFRTVDSHIWITNKKLLQISTIISRTSNESNCSMEIETHLVHDKLFVPREKPSFKCLVVRENPEKLEIEWKLLDTGRIKYSESNGNMVLVIANCVWRFVDQWSQTDIETVYAAVIDEKKFPGIRESIVGYQSELILHKPRVITRFKTKTKSSINCVHNLRNLNPRLEENIANWVKIQKLIGVDMVSFCLIDYHNKFVHELKAKSDNYIEINEYIIRPERMCERLKINNSPVCNSSFLDQVPMSLHEKICDCACLLYHKYHYQYLSNYDIDDVIMPRLHSTSLTLGETMSKEDLETNCSSTSFTKFLTNYTLPSVPQYLARLEKKHTGKPIGCFIFSHYLALHHEDLFEKMANRTRSSKFVISYKFGETNTFLDYTVNSKQELAYFENLMRSVKLNKCVKDNKLMSDKLNIEWKRGIKSLVANRYGKSIANTDHVYSLNPHSCSMYHDKDAIQMLKVPANEGFVSHMRHRETGTTGAQNRVATLTYGVSSLTVDLEYLYFLIENKQAFDLN